MEATENPSVATDELATVKKARRKQIAKGVLYILCGIVLIALCIAIYAPLAVFLIVAIVLGVLSFVVGKTTH